VGYKQLLEVERGWRDMKQILDLRPVYHRLEDRIRAHVVLCWLALLLIRVAETTTGQTWASMRRELHRLHAVTFTGPTGTFRQRTDPTKPQLDLYAQLGLPLQQGRGHKPIVAAVDACRQRHAPRGEPPQAVRAAARSPRPSTTRRTNPSSGRHDRGTERARPVSNPAGATMTRALTIDLGFVARRCAPATPSKVVAQRKRIRETDRLHAWYRSHRAHDLVEIGCALCLRRLVRAEVHPHRHHVLGRESGTHIQHATKASRQQARAGE